MITTPKITITRRDFLKQAAIAGLGAAVLSAGWPLRALAQSEEPPGAPVFNFIKDPDNPTPLEAEHMINVRLPLIAEDGSNVPMVISMEHPMEPDHYIKNIQVVSFRDPIVGKGLYHFTPANGQAYLSIQIRMDGGDSEVFVIAECSQHGRWVTSATLKVSLGGC